MNYLWDIVSNSVSYVCTTLGIWSKSGKLVFLGLDNAGKTTLLHMLKANSIAQHVPTLHPSSEELTIAGMTFTTYDLGGHSQARKVWKSYFPAVDGIVFIVDCSDVNRLAEAKEEIQSLLEDEAIANVPMVVLGNKIDKPAAISEYDLVNILQLGTHINDPYGRPVRLFMCSVLKKQGYGDAFNWLAQYLK